MTQSYVLKDAKWGMSSTAGTPGGTVTYTFAQPNIAGHSFTSYMTPEYQAVVRAAFGAWSAIANIDFREADGSALNPDLLIGWGDTGTQSTDGSAYAGVVTPKTGSDGTLAHADMILDRDVAWSLSRSAVEPNTVSFYGAMLHEIGIAIGLDDVDNEGLIMYNRVSGLLALGPGDIAGAQHLYGARATAFHGTAGNDTFYGSAGDDNLFGEAGVDTVQIGLRRAQATVTYAGNGEVMVASPHGNDIYHGIERLQFYDGTLAFDSDGTAGTIYRLFQAAFDRVPDKAALGYWVALADAGTPIANIAQAMTQSGEFATVYGVGASGIGAIDEMYEVVLDRHASSSDTSYWAGQLASGKTLADALLTIASSQENITAQADAMAAGIWLAPTVVGTAGADRFRATGASDSFHGGAGLDTVEMGGSRAAFTISNNAGTVTVTGAGTDTFTGIERMVFNEGIVAFDLDGAAGNAYRLYQAAFNRVPDSDGLAYQVARLDAGASLSDVAAGFVASPEFTGAYGGLASHAQLVQQLYHNVLHRDGEAAGIAYWSQQLDSGTPLSTVLIGFSESTENRAAVGGSIKDGIWL